MSQSTLIRTGSGMSNCVVIQANCLDSDTIKTIRREISTANRPHVTDLWIYCDPDTLPDAMDLMIGSGFTFSRFYPTDPIRQDDKHLLQGYRYHETEQ